MSKAFNTLLLFIFLFSVNAFAQEKVWVQFSDKEMNQFSLMNPEDFLSPKALERRINQGISLEESDLPVSPTYLSMVRDLGAEIILTSKWLNGALVIADENLSKRLESLPVVKEVLAVGKYKQPKSPRLRDRSREGEKGYKAKPELYGSGKNQIEQLNGHLIHKMGYRGEGMIVAVLDGGFINVEYMPFFDSLRHTGRILNGWDFVDNDPYPFDASSHGSKVLSIMASNLPGLFVGTAPDASYVCIRTEDVGYELLVEEYNWVAGAEFADSIGADVINSSLGYTDFDKSSQSHSYKDLDGKTTVVTQGANMAFMKGILVVNSAGNEGADEWKYIGAPADGTGVFSIGAVDKYGNTAYFSSYGPSFDGRIKPNVSANGYATVVASLNGYTTSSASGTSFASPVLAGMAASLWQAFPEKTNADIMGAIEASGNLYKNPDPQLGYGIPDFYKAYQILSEDYIHLDFMKDSGFDMSNISTSLGLLHKPEMDRELNIRVFNILGKEVYSQSEVVFRGDPKQFRVKESESWAPGTYFLEISSGFKQLRYKLLKG